MYSPLRFKIWLYHFAYQIQDNLYDKIADDSIMAFAVYCEKYYSSTYTAISILVGFNESTTIELLTNRVFIYLNNHRELFSNFNRRKSLLYHVTMNTVVAYLRESGDDNRIAYLQSSLPDIQPIVLPKNDYL